MASRYIGVKVSEDLDGRVREMAKQMNIPVSEVVKEALYRFLQEETEVDRVEHLITQSGEKSSALVRSLLKDAENNIVGRIIKRLNEMAA